MSLFSTTRATKVLALTLAIGVSGLAATAEAGGQERHRGITNFEGVTIPRHERRRHDANSRHHGKWRDQRVAERDRPWRTQRNFYGGAISAYRDPGNGTYFYIDRDDAPAGGIDAPVAEGRQTRVILVTPGMDNCSWESGVCVIRP
jgi:hypothetical protein